MMNEFNCVIKCVRGKGKGKYLSLLTGDFDAGSTIGAFKFSEYGANRFIELHDMSNYSVVEKL